jgi:4-amino-4-deoxy-L-arabinose transferase-like glycosyltransferase
VRAGIFTLLGLETTLFFVAKSSSIQTEQPLVLFWLLGLWALTRYVRTGRSLWLVLAGVAGGLGALSKYTMILFYLGWMAYVTIVPARRREWLNPWNYVAGLISLALFLPVIYWNATHDWMSFRFQLSKSIGENAVLGLTPLIFVAGSLLTYSPVLAAWGYRRTLRRSWRNDGPDALLIVMGWVAMLFFVAVLADATYSDPHWAVLSMITLFVWLGGEAQRVWARGDRRRVLGLYLTAGAINVLVLGAIFVHIFSPWVRGQLGGDRGDDVLGWDRTAQLVQAELERRDIPPPKYVVSFFYPLASHFALHLGGQPYSMSLERHQRNLWIDPNRLTPDNTLIVCQKPAHCRWIRADLWRYYGLRMGGLIGEVRQPIRGEERLVYLYALDAGVDAAQGGQR